MQAVDSYHEAGGDQLKAGIAIEKQSLLFTSSNAEAGVFYQCI